jgi:hypothetical protein
MKPKTKLQKQVVSLGKTLPGLTHKQHEWAMNNIPSFVASRRYKSMYCMECNHSWKDYGLLDLINQYVHCPNCGRKCKIMPYERNRTESVYFAVLTAKKDFQVVRMFVFEKFYSYNKSPQHYISEVIQHWVRKDGVITTLSKKTNNMSVYLDQWVNHSILEIRNVSYRYIQRNNLIPWKIYPCRRILPVLKRNGFKGFFYGIPCQILFSQLLSNPRAETLLKTNQTPLLNYMINDSVNLDQYWASIKIAIRNNYIVEKPSDWIDYIQLLSFFGKDLHSNKYVCPENLQKEHDYCVRLKKKKDAANRKKELQEEFETFQSEYEKSKNKFLDLVFSNGRITVKPLTHVSEFYEISEIHSHCLYSNEYFKKQNSLLLQALINNNPVETVEFSLKSLKIMQCYGKFNKTTKYHSEIINLVNSNISAIAQRI